MKKIFKDKFIFLTLLSILFLHLIIFFIRKISLINIDWYIQVIHFPYPDSDFFRSVWYYHAEAPGISIINFIIRSVSGKYYEILFTLILAFLQGLSFFWFYSALKYTQVRFAKWISLVLFLNPLVFIYFKYPFYSTFLFVTSAAVLFVLFSDRNYMQKVLLLSFILGFNVFIRASWHIVFVFLILLPFWNKVPLKTVFISILILILPFGLYVKNYVLFQKFTASTKLGMNLARNHIPPDAEKPSISKIPAFSDIKMYEPYLDRKSPLLQKYQNIRILNDTVANRLNNIRIIPVSDLYFKDVIKNFSIKYSVKSSMLGFFRILQSPARYYCFYPDMHIPDVSGIGMYDFFDLPDIPVKLFGVKFNLPFSLYTIIYPLAWLLLLLFYSKMMFEEWVILIMTTFFTVAYMLIDNNEANRMRFEIEPFWYFLVVLACMRTTDYFKSKKDESQPKTTI
jgi:hypothetical protein